MFSKGQILEKNGKKYIVIEKLLLNKKEYVLFAVGESKIDSEFYEVTNKNQDGYDLKKVTDLKLKKQLYDAFMNKNY